MIIGFGGWRGVGASTAALVCASAMRCAGDLSTALVEVDPAGGVLAARLGLHRQHAGTMEHLAAAATRRGGAGAGVDVAPLASHAVDHGGLRVVTAPGDPFRAWSCVAGRSTWIDRLDELADDVVVDLGRLRGGHPLGTLLERLHALVLVCAPDAISLATAAMWAEQSGRTSPGERPLPVDVVRIAVVEPPAWPAASHTDAAAELGDRLAGRLPWDPATVEHLERGGTLHDRRVRRRPLSLAAHRIADAARTWVRGDEGSAA